MIDIDKKLVFCKRCQKLKPMKSSAWDFIRGGFICSSCCRLMLQLDIKEDKK